MFHNNLDKRITIGNKTESNNSPWTLDLHNSFCFCFMAINNLIGSKVCHAWRTLAINTTVILKRMFDFRAYIQNINQLENLCKQSTQKLLFKKKCNEVKELINVTTFQEKLSQFDVSFFDMLLELLR